MRFLKKMKVMASCFHYLLAILRSFLLVCSECIASVFSNRVETNPIPSPTPSIPLIGHVVEFVRVFGPISHEWLLKRHAQFGRIYCFKAFGRKMVYLFKLEDFLALKQAEGKYPEHFDFTHLRLYRKQKRLPHGLLVSNGEDWSRQRRSVSGMMTRTSRLSCYYTDILEIAEGEVCQLTESWVPGTVEMEGRVNAYVMKAMSSIILGLRETSANSNWTNVKEIIEISRANFEDAKILMSLPSWLWSIVPAWWRHSSRWDRLLSITKSYMEDAIKTGVSSDSVLGDLLNTATLTLPEIHMNVTDLILASVDTTSSTLMWVLHDLSVHPEVQERLRRELAHTSCSSKTWMNLQQCEYLRAVIRESLRLHPVGFFVSRMIQTDTSLHGYRLQKGTHVACSMYTAGHDQKLFPDSKVYRPERWLEQNSDLEGFHSNVHFGFGKRMCVGRKVAELVIMVYIYQFVKTTSFTSANSTEVEPTFRILMVPNREITLLLSPLT